MTGPAGIVALLALAAAPAEHGKLLPEADAPAACFALADWTLQAGEAMRRGTSMEEHLRAGGEDRAGRPEERRKAVEDVYRDRPGDLSDYIAARLGACLRAQGMDMGDLIAKACYDRTLWAGTFFLSKQRGVPLERLEEGYGRDTFYGGAYLTGIARAVYGTHKSEHEFRRDQFVDCVVAR